ncbi:MAG: universal stress protein [Halobacteria archaeon]|nr:universal stress protein [Halobacteria archaeon]
MYNVLLAVDENEDRAITEAETISELPGKEDLKVTVLYVFTDNPSGASATQIATVRDAIEHLEDHGIETEVLESSGDPSTEILDTAEEEDVDMICLGGRKRSATGKVLFGSVTQSVILNTDRPVMVTGTKEYDEGEV